MINVVDLLKARGMFQDMTSPDLARVVEQPTPVYAGFDPTSNSLQVGNYVTIMGLAHFQRCGHPVIALVGGATGLIGDPSGKSAERQLLSAEDVERNAAGIRENLSRFLDFDSKTAPARLVNNYDWMKDFSFIGFLRDVGKYFRVGAMLDKESVKARLEGEAGLSFCEFSYQLLQAYDFLHLRDAFGCRIQIGGSDQWGNITAGTELIRRLRGEEAFGLTFPILCDSSGKKFGKSAGNSIYLDERRTSCYQFYQFFLRTEDADVMKLLRVLTFLPEEELRALEAGVRAEPEKRAAQRRLAETLTRTVHGDAGLAKALAASEVLFGGAFGALTADELEGVFADVPSTTLPRERVVGVPLADLAVEAGLCASKGEVRRLAAQGGLYVNNLKASDPLIALSPDQVIGDRMVVLRAGRKSYRLVKIG